MRLGAIGPRTFGQKLSTLIIAAPCLVLAITLAFGYLAIRRGTGSEEVRNFRLEMAARAQALDSFFDKVALLPRCFAARQGALVDEALPDPDTPNILRQTLDTAAPSECYGIYLAFDGINPILRPEGLQGVNRGSAAPTVLAYDHNIDREARSEWYWGTKSNWVEKHRAGETRKKTQPYYTEPYFDKGATNILVVSVTQAVEDRKGNFIGVAGADMDCRSLDKFIRSIIPEEGRGAGNVSGGMVAYLLSPQGYVIAQTDRQVPENLQRPARMTREEGGHLILSEEGPEDWTRLDGVDGRRLLFWKAAKTSNWKIVLSIPEAMLYAPARRMTFQLASLPICGLVFMVAIVSYLARLVTGPFPRLTAAAEAVESGDYRADGLVEIAARRDEFGQLARGFRRMVAEVSAREDQLRQAQDDLIRRERHFRSLIENGSDLITVLERDGTIRYESPSIRRVLGYEPQDLVGNARFDMVHPGDLQTVTEGMARLIGGQNIDRPVEYRFRHKSGEWRTLEATGTNLLDDPAVGGIVINSRDVTERKLAEAELDALRRRHSEELEQRVRLRTAELAQKNEELTAAKEATDQAMKQQEIFLSNVAHDLRTPLTIVIGFSEDLLRRARRKGQDAFVPDLKLIVNRGKDLLELINDLLNLSKSMNDKGVELDSVRFEIEPMIRSRMEGIGSIAQRQGNAIEFSPGPGLGSMVADEAKVWRILMNLLTNSCKFTKGGSITLDATREPGVSGDRIVFRVIDNGMGMSPEQTARLFDRFAQVHAGSGKMQAGVGLGLSICQLYCRAMGGTLSVESAIGRGTTFTVAIPAAVESGLANVSQQSPRPIKPTVESPVLAQADPEATMPADRANLVLIIDDDASICELMRRNLGEEGYRTECAASGEDGLRLAKQLLPSAIILDVVMPGIDGWAVLAALKTDAQMASIPIIMASMLDEKERGLKAGADEYLSKPFSGGRLADLLRKHIGEWATARLLVVEDDADTRDRLARSLREQGWEVAEAADAEEALASLVESAPDVILLDLMLPGRDGLGVIAEVRSNPAWQSIPIIVVTAANLDAEARRRLRGQVEKIFIKDLIGRDDLIREVRLQIEQHRREAPPTVVEQAHA